MSRKTLSGLCGAIFCLLLGACSENSSQKAAEKTAPEAVALEDKENEYVKEPIGVSYAEVMNYIDNFFVMKSVEPVDGDKRWMGQRKVAVLEIIGEKENILSASLIIGVPNDAPEVLIENSAILLRFVKNVLPEWKKAGDWVTAAIKGGGETQTVRGDKLVEVSVIESLSMITVSVKHVESD